LVYEAAPLMGNCLMAGCNPSLFCHMHSGMALSLYPGRVLITLTLMSRTWLLTVSAIARCGKLMGSDFITVTCNRRDFLPNPTLDKVVTIQSKR